MGRIIAIDWDHTIFQNELNQPYPGVHEAIDAFRSAGWKILIHSCNNPAHIRKLCEEHNIRPDWIWGEEGVEGNKPIADVYIDDRAYHFQGDWAKTQADVMERLKPVRPGGYGW